MKKSFGLFLVIILLSLPLQALSFEKNPWHNICDDPGDNPGKYYCENVGKTAYNAFGHPALRDVALGKIIGVAWRPKGSAISTSGRVSPRNAYYYIIDDGGKIPFLRQCREIDAK